MILNMKRKTSSCFLISIKQEVTVKKDFSKSEDVVPPRKHNALLTALRYTNLPKKVSLNTSKTFLYYSL